MIATLNLSLDRSKYGYRMLERMGWSEGRGLGLNEDGPAEPVKVHRKKDCSGQLMVGVVHNIHEEVILVIDFA